MSHCERTMDAAWYANRTLSPETRREFEAHLASCPHCRAALTFDERLARTLEATAANVVPAPQTAWRKLEARLDEAAATGPTVATSEGAMSSSVPADGKRSGGLIQFAVAAQAAAILILVGVLWTTADKPEVQGFRTLGSGDPAVVSPVPLIRVVFAPGYTAADAEKVAAGAGAELHGRFEGTEIYTLAVPVGTGESRSDRLARVLATLRQNPDVRMAEPITDPQAPSSRP